MKLKIAISSCPNDTFMFDALLNNKIDTKGYSFELKVADIEQLNSLAFNNETDITKISFHSYFKIIENYQILNSGAALGKNCGPLIISKRKIDTNNLKNCKIAIPGDNTTANLLLKIFFKDATNKHEYLFSDIEDAVLQNKCDVGLVIHETRFTYKQRELKLVADLGNIWEETYRLPIPLGGIAIKRRLPEEVKKDIDNILKQSILFAIKNPDSALKFMKKYAQDIEDDIMMKHVNLYVNDYSVDISKLGKEAVLKLKNEFDKTNRNPEILTKSIFLSE